MDENALRELWQKVAGSGALEDKDPGVTYKMGAPDEILAGREDAVLVTLLGPLLPGPAAATPPEELLPGDQGRAATVDPSGSTVDAPRAERSVGHTHVS